MVADDDNVEHALRISLAKDGHDALADDLVGLVGGYEDDEAVLTLGLAYLGVSHE